MIRHVSRKKNERGISTVLGILLMVGILLSSVIPLFMYVNEVNNYYDRTVVDLKIADQERGMEDLAVWVYGQTSTAIEVFIVNRSPLSVNVTRIWVMRIDLQKNQIYNSSNHAQLPSHIIASSQKTLSDINITIITGNELLDYFNIEVVTERGNKFPAENNPIHRSSTGEWESTTEELEIQVIVLSDWGLDKYKVEVEGIDNTTIGYYDSLQYETHGDYLSIFIVPTIGSYNVTVTNMQGAGTLVGASTVSLSWTHPKAYRKFDDT